MTRYIYHGSSCSNLEQGARNLTHFVMPDLMIGMTCPPDRSLGDPIMASTCSSIW